LAGSFSPTEAAPGAPVTLTGSFMKQVTGVLFAGQPLTTQNSFTAHSNEVVVTVPENAQDGAITVEAGVGGAYYSKKAFTVES